MNNLLLTPNLYAKFVCMNLGTDLFVCKNMCHDVTPEFLAKKNPIGASVMVRKPYRFNVTKGLGYQPQPVVDTQTPVTVSQVAGAITPNPGGVGPMTIAMLLSNTVRAAEMAGQ